MVWTTCGNAFIIPCIKDVIICTPMFKIVGNASVSFDSSISKVTDIPLVNNSAAPVVPSIKPLTPSPICSSPGNIVFTKSAIPCLNAVIIGIATLPISDIAVLILAVASLDAIKSPLTSL